MRIEKETAEFMADVASLPQKWFRSIKSCDIDQVLKADSKKPCHKPFFWPTEATLRDLLAIIRRRKNDLTQTPRF